MPRLHLLSRALAPLLCCLWTAAASAQQTIYRCGNTYSQTPCGSGHTLTIDDSRTAQQKSQTDAATVQTRQLALQLERERVALEKAAMVTGPQHSAGQGKDKAKPAERLAAPSGPGSAKSKAHTRPRKSGTELELFAAPVTVDKKALTGTSTAKGR